MNPLWSTLRFLVLLASAPVLADTVFLKDGTKREGKVVAEKDAEIAFSVGLGEMFVEVLIPRASIDRIERATTRNEQLLEEYRDRLARLDDTRAQSWYELGAWCDQQPYLSRQASRAYETAIELDPDHAAARQKLGFVRYRDEWMPAEKALHAQQAEEAQEAEGGRDRTRELIDAAFQQSAESLRDRALRAEAELAAERKMRQHAEHRIQELEDRLDRLEREVGRPRASSTLERRPIIILGDRCCARFPHPGTDCKGRPLPGEKPSDVPKTETKVSPSIPAAEP
ncbi:MAG: hypothetical protein HYU36_11235 [Planctomycetes bacterium]|nr:hypothetical protein [Planctomycetota bacterium]